ncbi:AraC family transcriptional regulator [Maribellus comscasis]|uniref:AraC family transcriptional regulator n=1 Tax=Maribellus comscasis TaxID=2681766 RepID=A0A6I6JLL5_9BACT|nr:AraC family transcriptional regulator [Maribellus comscasis]QGY42099.1 AraC family transcriptional regulator [Maribellus comscasis]
MLIKKRFSKIPFFVTETQKNDPLTSGLYLCEISELLFGRQTKWIQNTRLQDHLLIFCTKGEAKLKLGTDEVLLCQDQFCIISKGFQFEMTSRNIEPSAFITCHFNGTKTNILEQEFTVVRDLVPSINNRVANRKMLFDEIFSNLSRGYSNANMYYVNFTFAHLLATFIFAFKTSEDIRGEENPVIQQTIYFLEQNIDKKLTLKEISDEVGYSITYLSTIFKKQTNYSPLSYFSHLKITKSCEYLDQTKLKIKQIAFMLGYTDPYYFSKDFQKKMGMSPKKYRCRIK